MFTLPTRPWDRYQSVGYNVKRSARLCQGSVTYLVLVGMSSFVLDRAPLVRVSCGSVMVPSVAIRNEQFSVPPHVR